uniref:Thiamine biosynthesis protein S n=1 Tax=Gelidium vagum TaxID=35171 RepID=A0A141SE95_GELVA|nr:thiamine biosynthesis protein S [Gelidium vagum]AMK96613.1 thiamine biosynthesis protein S [Gelidium vagum]
MSLVYNTIILNGRPLNCFPETSLYDLLVYYQFDINSIIIEYNHKIVSNDNFPSIILKSDDKVEVITIVGGG